MASNSLHSMKAVIKFMYLATTALVTSYKKKKKKNVSALIVKQENTTSYTTKLTFLPLFALATAGTLVLLISIVTLCTCLWLVKKEEK